MLSSLYTYLYLAAVDPVTSEVEKREDSVKVFPPRDGQEVANVVSGAAEKHGTDKYIMLIKERRSCINQAKEELMTRDQQQSQDRPGPAEPGPCRARTQQNQDPAEPGPSRARTSIARTQQSPSLTPLREE
ncbi:unnamed protein product [Boreogadus saida]